MAKTLQIFVENEVICLTKHGVWTSNGTEIEHSATLRAFFKHLQKDSQGYFLAIGPKGKQETKRITVEDTAYFVRSLEGDPQTGYQVLCSNDQIYPLEPKTIQYQPSRLTCKIETHTGIEEAKFLPAPYFEILKHLEEDSKGYFLRIKCADSLRVEKIYL